jgi:hypothetical protein
MTQNFQLGSTDGKDISNTTNPPSVVTINFDQINLVLDEYSKIAQDDSLITTISELKNVINWVSKGKKLLDTDVKFSNTKILKKVLQYVKNKIKIEDFKYLQKKIKEPMNVDMTKQKEEMAKSTIDKNQNVDNLIAVSSI